MGDDGPPPAEEAAASGGGTESPEKAVMEVDGDNAGAGGEGNDTLAEQNSTLAVQIPSEFQRSVGPGKNIQFTNLNDFLEHDTKAVIDSPRSLQACKQEGVAPQDLIYKPIEAFAEKGLEPRLVKLRYDFFEAKRKDLLAACRRARDIIIESEVRERNRNGVGLTLQEMSQIKGVPQGVLQAVRGDSVKQERMRMKEAQRLQMHWLNNTLSHQLHLAQKLESMDKFMQEEQEGDEAAQKAASDRMRAMNEARRENEERKMAEMMAQQKLEQQIAKEEFERQLQEMEELKKQQARDRKERFLKSCADQEAKRKAEEAKAEKRRQAWLLQQQRTDEMKANDDRRNQIRALQKAEQQRQMREAKKFREDRIALSMKNLRDREGDKYGRFMAKQAHEKARDERLQNLKLLQKEDGARNSYKMMMKRKAIFEEAERKREERRNNILEHHAEVEHRMMMHEMKKERYLEFKGELDGLKEKNKEINVIRQRRKEDQRREDWAEAVKRKDDKIDMLNHERQFLWGLRRETGAQIQKAREHVKDTITQMKINSNYDSKLIERKLGKIFKKKIFNTDYDTVDSMPNLNMTTLPPVSGAQKQLDDGGDTTAAGGELSATTG